MEQVYFFSSIVLALVVGAVALFCAVVALAGKTWRDFGFALTGSLVILFFVMPPEGFGDGPMFLLWSKRILLTIFALAIPWYLIKFSSVNRSGALIATLGFTTLFVALQASALLTDITSYLIVTSLLGISILGLRAVVWNGQREWESRFVRVAVIAMTSYQFLFIMVTVVSVTGLVSPGTLSSDILAVYVCCAILFVLTLAGMLATASAERSRLEKTFEIKERRLQSVMQNVPVMLLEIEPDGRIANINDYGARLLGYQQTKDLININWFTSFILPSDIDLLRKIHNQVFSGNLVNATFKSTVRTRNGREMIISWVNFIAQEPDGSVRRVISVGRDISGEESANKLVAQLQKELEKENITMKEGVKFEIEEDVVGKSKAFTYAIQRARQVAITHAPVLLEGETGVGKEVFANLIHKNSSRKDLPFIKVNCAALPKELIEDELFGHEKGAFTSAIQARKGRFELADGGTIFLDEIGELPLDMQPKLLRVLQNGEFERVGGQKTIKVDVRILAATNRNLMEEITKGSFREDLYYRLNVFPITIPPLRNRQEDLPELIQYFIATKSKEYKKSLNKISSADMEKLMGYKWPGNIRELKNVVERAVIASEGHVFKLDWWQEVPVATESMSQSLEQVEHDHILTVMERCGWKINGNNGAAEILNMHPNTLRSKMKRLGIIRPLWRNPLDMGHDNGDLIPRGSLG